MNADTAASASPSLENAIAGKYDFSVKAILSQAWEKNSGFKWHFWKALLLVVLVIVVISIPVYMIAGMFGGTADVEGAMEGVSSDGNWVAQVANLLMSIFVFQPLFAGLLMVAVKHSVGQVMAPTEVFTYFKYWSKLWVLPVISAVIGLCEGIFGNVPLIQLIFIFVLLYVLVSYFMYMPLIVEKQMQIWPAMEGSRKAIGHHWFKTLWFLIVLGVITFVSALTFGILFIWTLPWIYNAIAIYYRDIFGVSKA